MRTGIEDGESLALKADTSNLIVFGINGDVTQNGHGEFYPNYNAPTGTNFLGTFHVHPDDGGGADSFSGADIKLMFHPIWGSNVSIVEAEGQQYMLLKTWQSSRDLSVQDAIKTDWSDVYFKDMTKYDKSSSIASNHATTFVADKYHLAYYRGKNGTLIKINK